MSKRDPQILLEDIRDAIGKIERYCAGLSRDDFLGDDKTVDAVVRNLEIIGEAVRRLPDDFKDAHPGIPWSQIGGLRNRIVHDYSGLDLELIWEVVQQSVPELSGQIVDLEEKP